MYCVRLIYIQFTCCFVYIDRIDDGGGGGGVEVVTTQQPVDNIHTHPSWYLRMYYKFCVYIALKPYV